jgi:hypothetical protein
MDENRGQFRAWFKGVKLNDSYVYVITNMKSKKEYIGETDNIIGRFDSYSMNRFTNNSQLVDDIEKYGHKNFTVKFIKSRKRKELEKKMIEKSKNCYNVLYTDRKNTIPVPKKVKDKYKVASYKFDSKQQIKDFIRKTLDSLEPGTYINKDSDLFKFASELIRYNPTYNDYNFLEKGKNVRLVVKIDDENGTGNYNIFTFEWDENETWGFSTNKCIKYL